MVSVAGGTNWNLEVVEIMEEAYERAGVDKLLLNADHSRSARRSMNLILKSWANASVRPWALERTSFLTTAGIEEEYLQEDTIDILDVTLKRENYEIPMTRLSRGDYANLPDKAIQGRPDRYYLHKDIDQPSMFIYQTPINATDEVIFWRVRRLIDVTSPSDNVDAPVRWVDPFIAELAYRLYEKRPEVDERKLLRLELRAEKLFDLAAEEDRDRAPLQIVPDMTTYS